MTDAERLAEGLLIFLKKPGPTQDDFKRWTQIFGAHHMHIRVLIQIAEKILDDRDHGKYTVLATTSEEITPNTSGEIHESGPIIQGDAPTELDTTNKALHHYSSAERTLRPLEPGGELDRGDGRGGHGRPLGDGPQTELPNFGYGGKTPSSN